MKKKCYKIICIVFFTIILIFANKTYINAASANISASNTNVEVGDNVTINVSVNAIALNIKVNGSGISDSIIGYDMDNNGAVDYYRYYAVQEEPNSSYNSANGDYHLSDVTFTNTRIGIVNYRVHFDWKVGSRRPDMEKVSIRIKADYHDGSQPQYITVNGQDEIEIPLITDTEGNYVDDYYITNLPKYTKTGKAECIEVKWGKTDETRSL